MTHWCNRPLLARVSIISSLLNSQPFTSSPFHFLDLSRYMSNFDPSVFDKQFLTRTVLLTVLDVLGRTMRRHHYHHSRRPHTLNQHHYHHHHHYPYNYPHRRFCLTIFELFATFVMVLHFQCSTPYISNNWWWISMWKTRCSHENWITIRISSLDQFPLFLPL